MPLAECMRLVCAFSFLHLAGGVLDRTHDWIPNIGDAPGTALLWINNQAHSVPLMQIMDGRFLGFDSAGSASVTEKLMSLGTLLLIVLILLLVGAIPTWPHSKSWGYAPSGVLGLVVVIIIVLLLMGRL